MLPFRLLPNLKNIVDALSDVDSPEQAKPSSDPVLNSSTALFTSTTTRSNNGKGKNKSNKNKGNNRGAPRGEGLLIVVMQVILLLQLRPCVDQWFLSSSTISITITTTPSLLPPMYGAPPYYGVQPPQYGLYAPRFRGYATPFGGYAVASPRPPFGHQ
ncbi:hypothetical protein Tco_0004337 [Tanacetum coccineum]